MRLAADGSASTIVPILTAAAWPHLVVSQKPPPPGGIFVYKIATAYQTKAEAFPARDDRRVGIAHPVTLSAVLARCDILGFTSG
jgi:hypothetical protein